MPLSAARIVDYERLVTPPEHLGVLVEPDAARIVATLREPAAHTLDRAGLLDTTIGALRAELRGQLDLTGPVILTGHQPEFIHAGVFAKIIAARVLADEFTGAAAFLAVDSDLPKSARIAAPQTPPHGLRRVEVPIPGCDPQRPYEGQPRAGRAEWLQFFASLTSLVPGGDRTLLPAYARAWLTTPEPQPAFCDALLRAQAASAAALGLNGVRELRMSNLCATPAFRAFVAHLALEAPRCAAAYNAAQAAYRARHKVRTPGRPVPPLAVHGDTVELPLWAWRPDEPRRRLFVTARGRAGHADELEFATDNRRIGLLPVADLARSATHAQPWPLERDGWRLRPRALALSCFGRYFLADLFIHGIGGAKYDELMEDFARDFFGVEPRPLCCVTATLHMPLPHTHVRPPDIAAARHAARDVRHNPQRRLTAVPAELLRERAALVRRSEELRRDRPADRANRRLTFSEIRRVNGQMLAAEPWKVAEYDARVETLAAQWEQERIALDREYFFALHPQANLHALVEAARRKLGE